MEYFNVEEITTQHTLIWVHLVLIFYLARKLTYVEANMCLHAYGYVGLSEVRDLLHGSLPEGCKYVTHLRRVLFSSLLL